MFDFSVSTHSHFDEECRAFSAKHNITQLARKAGLNPQTIRNKLNPDQVHQLKVREMLILTDLTEDSTLVDGALAQLQCLPCVPVNEIAQDNLLAYVLKATAEVGQLAADLVSQRKFTSACRRGFVQNVNVGIRCLTLSATTKERYNQCQNINLSCTFKPHETVSDIIMKPGSVKPVPPHSGRNQQQPLWL